MKQLIKETRIGNKRNKNGVKVITYGYDTKVKGLSVIRTVNKNYKEFTPIQNHSGLGLGVYFCSPMNAVRFANKYFTPFDFNVPEKDIIENQGIKDIVFAYHAKEI